MLHRRARARSIALALLTLTATFAGIPPAVRADPVLIDNPAGTSTAFWNFTNPADYAAAGTSIAGAAALQTQTQWWNSTSAADFSGPDSATNADLAQWPGNVVLRNTSGPSTILSLQPGPAAGEDAWLDRNNGNANHGADTTIILDGRNPHSRPILRFDLSTIPVGVAIDGATLNLYQSAGVGLGFTASVYHVTADWSEGQVTWNERLTGTAWGLAGGDFSGHVIGQATLDNTAGWRTWNITQLVDLWYRGRIPNQGLVLNAPSTGADADKTFFSSDYAVDPARRPLLDISFRPLGATGEYVSEIGGPATQAQWQAILWNATARSLVSDGFDGAALDPKWAWTNVPPSYDVGTTTPGQLHVVSTSPSDIFGSTLTGNVLANDVVGDFTAELKFATDPNQGGQKAGLMVLLSARDWYGIQKRWDSGSGTMRWQVRSTVDAVTATPVDILNTNPNPTWVRIGRTGDTFSAYESVDGSAWTLRHTYTPGYEYPLSIRIAFFAADGNSGTPLAVDVDYICVRLGMDATVAVQTRTGDTTPVDGTWSGWSAPYPSSSGSAMVGASRYVEFRLSLAVTYPDHTPNVGDVNISWSNYVASGTVDTQDLVPANLAEWGDFGVSETLNGQSIAYAYSLDSGGSWTPVTPPASLLAVSVATGRIRFRATLSTTDNLVTPVLSQISLTYRHVLDHFFVTASAAATAGSAFSVTVTAKDALNATITGWTGAVTLAAVLLDGVTPGGGVLGATSLAIAIGGTATLATETYTRAEAIRILASFGPASGLSGPIAVSAGALDRMDVTPNAATLLPFDTQPFAAQGFDVWNNPIPGLAYAWTVIGGIGTLNTSTGQTVLFTASPPPANGTLEASVGGTTGVAAISVVSGIPPWVAISSPIGGDHLTGAIPITYANSTDAVNLTFEYDAGAGWILIGTTSTLNGTFVWNASSLNFVGGSLRATVENNRTITNTTGVSPIEVDNTPPAITIGAIVDDQGTSGTLTIPYATASDVVRVDLTYFDGAWRSVGADLTIDGSFVWTPGLPINGVTLRAVAVDDVDLTGADEVRGVGTRVVGTNPPAIAAIPTIRVRAGLAYDLNLTAYLTDPDTLLSALTISTSDAANVTVSPGAYPWARFLYAAIGTYPVTLWVSDGTDTAWRIVQVEAYGGNPPVLAAPLGIVSFPEDTIAANAIGAPLTSRFTDADGDTLTFAVLDAVQVSWQVTGNATLDFWAPANWYGVETVRVRATDPSGAFAEAGLVVTVWAVNDAPVIAPIANLSIGKGARYALDLTPFLSDVDNSVSQLLVSTDTPYVTANGRVLTVQFPENRTAASFTVSVSDGQATAMRLVRVTFLPAWWENPFLLPVSILPLGLVVAVFARRARWRPAKAFLVDERRELLREFTLDASCEVTFEQVREAGALAATEGAVKVLKYQAQTVKGDALAIVLVAYGPVSMEMIGFAREMLVNIQDKFDDRVKARLEEMHSTAARWAAERAELTAAQTAFDTRSRAFAGAFDSITGAQAKMAAETQAVRSKVLDLEYREAMLRQERQAIEDAKAALAAERNEFDALAGRLQEEFHRRTSELDGVAARLQERDAKLREDGESFEAMRTEKTQWIASKDIELEARMGTLNEKEAAVRAQAEENARVLADLAAREEAHEIEGDRLEKVTADVEARKAALDATASGFEAKAAEIRDLEARKAEEYRAWQSTMESQSALLKEQQDTFERESREAREALVQKRLVIEEHEKDLTEREAKARASVESALRLEDESKARASAAVEAMAVAQDLKTRVDQERGELARTAADLTAREHALQAEAKHQADTMVAEREALKAQEVAAAENRAAAEHAFSDREARLQDAEAEMQGRTDAIEQRSLALLTREGGAEELRASLEREKADLDSLSRTLEARRVELDQITQRNEEEAARLRAETESLQQSVAAREADLGAEKERLERESQSLQDTLGAKAEELAGREKVLAAREEENGARSQELEARTRELETRERETAAHADELRGLAATVTDRQTAVAARAAQLEAASQAFSAEQEAKRREWESVQEVLRTEEARTKTEAEGRLSQVAARASELHKREQEMSAAIAKLDGDRARMTEHAKAIDVREAESAAAWTRAEKRIAEMRTLEAQVLRAREAFEAERSAWEPRRAEEMKQLEATRDAAGEQAQKAEALLEDAQRRATVAVDAERASKRKLEELSQKQLQVEARLKEVESAERATEAQSSEIQDATRKLAGREMELATMTKELDARQARTELKSKEVQAASSDLKARRTALDQEAGRISKVSAELEAQRREHEAKVSLAEARLAEAQRRERDLQKLEVEIVTREKALPGLERDLEKREWDIATREASLTDRLATADRGRLEVEGLTAKSDEDRRAAAAARVEANVLRESAEKLKAQVENQQAEVAKHMKFLQKKAVETLDRDERIRKTEQALAEREKVLDSQFEILETKAKAMEVEREEEAAKATRLEAEVDRLKARLADAEKGGAAGADLEERNKDLENRLKVIQRKAMELLDREEKVRLREEALKERADQLGVKM